VIVGVGADEVDGVSDLVAAVAGHEPGDSVVLTIRRGTKRVTLSLTLVPQPAEAGG